MTSIDADPADIAEGSREKHELREKRTKSKTKYEKNVIKINEKKSSKKSLKIDIDFESTPVHEVKEVFMRRFEILEKKLKN